MSSSMILFFLGLLLSSTFKSYSMSNIPLPRPLLSLIWVLSTVFSCPGQKTPTLSPIFITSFGSSDSTPERIWQLLSFNCWFRSGKNWVDRIGSMDYVVNTCEILSLFWIVGWIRYVMRSKYCCILWELWSWDEKFDKKFRFGTIFIIFESTFLNNFWSKFTLLIIIPILINNWE